jgi:hypothetical protein
MLYGPVYRKEKKGIKHFMEKTPDPEFLKDEKNQR